MTSDIVEKTFVVYILLLQEQKINQKIPCIYYNTRLTAGYKHGQHSAMWRFWTYCCKYLRNVVETDNCNNSHLELEVRR